MFLFLGAPSASMIEPMFKNITSPMITKTIGPVYETIDPLFRFKITTSGADTFTLPLLSTGSYDFLVDWGDGSTDEITAYNDSAVTHTYVSAGSYDVSISGTITGWAFDNSASAPKVYEISNWGNFALTTDTGRTFYGCSNMTWVDDAVNGFDTSNVISFLHMFNGCSVFNSPMLDFDTSNVTLMYTTFNGCALFNQALDHFDTEKVTSFNSFLANTSFDQSLASFNIEKATVLNNFLAGATLSTANYNATLIAWEAQDVNDNLMTDFGTSKYSGTLATEARSRLVADHNWTITDGGEDI